MKEDKDEMRHQLLGIVIYSRSNNKARSQPKNMNDVYNVVSLIQNETIPSLHNIY